MISDRVYENLDTSYVTYFVGKEVEKTAAYGKKTLFVVGIQLVDEIIKRAKANGVSHIYLAANQSFILHLEEHWAILISELLEMTSYMITIDHPLNSNEKLNKFLGNESTNINLIPMVSVPIANIQSINYNTIIKFDDTGFNETNPGVWCSHLSELLDNDQFTDWTEYTKDRIIE